MSKKPFVHLHTHTCYSMLDGVCRISDLVNTAIAEGMPAIAMTDHGVMYGAVDFYQTAIERGIKPIIGCELYITPGSRFDRHEDNPQKRHPIHHLVLLAENETGYHNLARLCSLAHIEGFYYKPRIDKELLAAHSDGLIGLSACLKGEVASHLTEDRLDDAVRCAAEYADILGKDNFFLEIQDHGIAEQAIVNRGMRSVAKQTGLRLVATNDVHYLEKEHAEAHEVLLALQTGTTISDPKRMRYQGNEFYLKSRAEMEALFPDQPAALDITTEIAERCAFEFDFKAQHFPSFPVPKGKKPDRYLHQVGMEGLCRLYGIKDPVKPADDREKELIRRYEYEFGVIKKTSFVDYFLVVWDFMHFSRENKIPVGPGRGSGGGSLLAYALGITTIDPIQYDLIFERFLNPERVSPPDFDIDFCPTRREEVINYVKNRYGSENVAQIITFGSLGAKNVIKDVGRVLEIPYAECDRLSKLVPDDPKISLEKAQENSPDFRDACRNDEHCKRIMKYATVLEGLYRNAGTHAAGVVIGEKPLLDIVPLALDKDKKQPITQYAKDPVEKIGLLKMDFLGLKTLTVMQEAVELIKADTGDDVDLANLPMDDPPTYELLNRGDTVGVFQLESPGMRDLLRRIGIERIQDLIAMIALYRPGPMNMLDDYVKRKTGKAQVEYPHALLQPVLEETYGIMIYQEQVQKAANILAGYSLGQADILRRAMGKKKPEEMQKQRENFVKGCMEHNQIPAAQAGRIFDNMEAFAGYGFNKAHSAGYAIICYQTAFLKANYPRHFMAALISSEIGNAAKLQFFVDQAREMGMEILAPDVNSSGVRFIPTANGIRFGLAGIKNVGAAAAQAIITECANEPYKSLQDFCMRLPSQISNRKLLESLVRAGACDCFGMHRARLFNGIEIVLANAGARQRDREAGQGNLFDLLDEAGEPGSGISDDLPDCPAWPESEALKAEKELLGIYLSGHPLTENRHLLSRFQLNTPAEVKDLPDETATRIGGIVARCERKITKKKQEAMAILQLEGLDGAVQVVVFPKTYEKYRELLQPDAPLLIGGKVSRKDDTPSIHALEIFDLRDAPQHFAIRLGLHLPLSMTANGKLEGIKKMLLQHPGKTPVQVCLTFPDGTKVFLDADPALKVTPNDELLGSLQKELGETGIHLTVNTKPLLEPENGFRRRRSFNGNRP